jgi:hypothetical protein
MDPNKCLDEPVKIDLENLINHVIFPIQLPNKGETSESFFEFMEITCNALSLIFEEPNESNEILRLFSRWTTLQSTHEVITFFYHKNLIKNYKFHFLTFSA